MISLACGQPILPSLLNRLTPDPWKLNILSRAIDLHARDPLPPDRAYLTTKLSSAEYNPDAQTPPFRTFLDRILPLGSSDASSKRAWALAHGWCLRVSGVVLPVTAPRREHPDQV